MTRARSPGIADVALLALTLRDPVAAREFVLQRARIARARHDERSELLCATLLCAYFASGQNAAAAAAALGVHDRTVRYRVRSIEERLGRSILARREELGVALRLAHVVLRDPASARSSTAPYRDPTTSGARREITPGLATEI